MRKLISIILITFLISGCAIVHNYDAYYGKIIDAETKEPLEGAAVLAVYCTQQYGPAGSVSHYLDAKETLTDKNGEFKIPSFTFLTFRVLQSFERDVWFTIFKPGYGCYPNNKGIKPASLRNGILPPGNYVTIELPKLMSKEERIENQRCEPTSIPYENYAKFRQLVNIEREKLGLPLE